MPDKTLPLKNVWFNRLFNSKIIPAAFAWQNSFDAPPKFSDLQGITETAGIHLLEMA